MSRDVIKHIKFMSEGQRDKFAEDLTRSLLWSASEKDAQAPGLSNIATEKYQILQGIEDQETKQLIWKVFVNTKMNESLYELVALEFFPNMLTNVQFNEDDKQELFSVFQNSYRTSLIKTISGYSDLVYARDIYSSVNFNLLDLHDIINALRANDPNSSLASKLSLAFKPKSELHYSFSVPRAYELSSMKSIANFRAAYPDLDKAGSMNRIESLPVGVVNHILSFLTNSDQVLGAAGRFVYKDKDPLITFENKSNIKANKVPMVARAKRIASKIYSQMHEERLYALVSGVYMLVVMSIFNATNLLWLPVITVASLFWLSHLYRSNKDFGLKTIENNIDSNFILFSMAVYTVCVMALFNLEAFLFLPMLVLLPTIFMPSVLNSIKILMFSPQSTKVKIKTEKPYSTARLSENLCMIRLEGDKTPHATNSTDLLSSM